MTLGIKNLAAAAGLTVAMMAAANGASAQPVTSQTVVQPGVVTTTTIAPVDANSVSPALQPLPYNSGPPPMTGAVAGTTAADRDGDGIIDGYYSSDGFYHPYVAPTPAPAPRYLSRRGERG